MLPAWQISSSQCDNAELGRAALPGRQVTDHISDKLLEHSRWNHSRGMNFSVTASGMKNAFFPDSV